MIGFTRNCKLWKFLRSLIEVCNSHLIISTIHLAATPLIKWRPPDNILSYLAPNGDRTCTCMIRVKVL